MSDQNCYTDDNNNIKQKFNNTLTRVQMLDIIELSIFALEDLDGSLVKDLREVKQQLKIKL
ncbi:MAG: hypothetical protein CMH22_05890 [Methylophaga sp.]|nr:hypothetical protein [Methylophaga sp.]|tara:strand:+ start:73657 stop:73839 length:183 start_codon:yes stop_codon:yes gene_type:complete